MTSHTLSTTLVIPLIDVWHRTNLLRKGQKLSTKESKSNEWITGIDHLNANGKYALILVGIATFFSILYGIMITVLTGSMPIYFGTTSNCDASRYASGQVFPPSTAAFYQNRFTDIGSQKFW